ncbi:MAG: NUDIX domain-containing protein, partial [Oscillospiraceae bacterium]|nr:NUDIX domain-containing protein [Oscillospiraceae bacterium]
ILRQNGSEAVRRRSESGLLAGLWEFPNVAGTLTEAQVAKQLAQWNLTPHRWLKKEQKKHIFTHIIWEMTVYTIETMGDGCTDWCWRNTENSQQYPMPTAFSKLSTPIGENA